MDESIKGMKLYLRNYRECIARFGKSTADAILRQVRDMEAPEGLTAGDVITCNGKFTLLVDMIGVRNVHVSFYEVL